MSKAIRIKLIALSVVLALFVVFSAGETFAWFGDTVTVYTADGQTELAKLGMRINLLFDRLDPDEFPNGSTITFPDGTTGTFDNDAQWGTKDNPYIISMARHMLNLYVLQRNGYFDERYISQNYDDNGNYIADSNIKPYFLVCDTAAAPTCVDGIRNGEPLELHPVGNDEYPFIGCVGGAQVEGTATAPNGKTSISSIISNFNVVSDVDEPDVGLFGYVGYLGDENSTTSEGGVEVFNGAVSGISDLLLYDVCVTGPTAAPAARDDAHRWANEVAQNVQYEEDHHVGILAGHVEYAAIQNISVYYSDSSKTAIDIDQSGANYMTDSAIIGLVYNLNPEINGNSIGSSSGTTIAGQVQGVGQEWGGSIDMKTMHGRLQNVLTTAKRINPRNSYTSAETVVINEVTGETTRTTTGTTRYTSATDDSETLQVYAYESEEGGSFVFSDDTRNSTRYNLMLGRSAKFFPKTVTTYTYKDEFVDAWYIHDGNNYLSLNGTALATVTGAENAAKWAVDASGHLYTVGETNTAMVKYYLNRNGATGLTLGTAANSATVWVRTNNSTADEFDTKLYTVNGGDHYYVDYDGGWLLTREHQYYRIADDAGHYLNGNTTAVSSAATADASAKWQLSDPAGATTTIYTIINNTNYYLNGNTGDLLMSTGTCTWNKDGDRYYVTVDGVRLYLTYNNGWTLTPDTGAYIQDGSGHYLTATYAASAASVGNAAQNAAAVWQFTSETGDTQIYTILNGQRYYLTCNNGLAVSGVAATWHRSGDSLYYTVGNKDYYLTYDNGWSAVPLTFFTIHNDDGHYLQVTGANTFADATAENATHFYFATENGALSSGKVYCSVNSNTYYLRNNAGTLETSNEANATAWTNDGDSLTVTDGNATYALEYDETWHIKNITPGFYITDGTNYLTVNGTTIDNTTNPAAATAFTFSNTTGANPAGTIRVVGTNNYLRNNNGNLEIYGGNTASNRTNWSNDGDNLYNGDYYVFYLEGSWTLSPKTYYLLKQGNYYMTNTSGTTLSMSTSSENAVKWDRTSGAIKAIGTDYYLYGATNGAVNLSTTSRDWTYSNDRLHFTANYRTYYLQRNRTTSWRMRTSAASTNITISFESVTLDEKSHVIAVDTTPPTVKVGEDALPAPEVTVDDYTPTETAITVTGPTDETLTFTKTSLQTVEKTVTTEPGGWDSYFPLVSENTSPFTVNPKNTGYVVSGSYASYQQASGDVRVSRYPMDSLSASYYNRGAITSYTAANARYMEILTRTYLSNGLKLVQDTYNANHTTGFSNGLSGYASTKTTPSSLGLKKYDAAREQLHETFLSDPSYIYGMHFMDSVISMDHLITAPQVTINEQTYYNYELPEDSIDFRLRTKGYINFFAGTYYTNNASFFSLYQIHRDDNNKITSIKRIEKIYGDPTAEKKPYIYKFENETTPTLPAGYVEMFDTNWIEHPTMVDNAVYYYEVPVNAGEYALGSVDGSYGAYLFYLDIGTSAADHSSVLGTIDFVYDNLADKIVVVPDVNDTDTSLNYYVPSMSVLFSKNTDENNTVDIDRFTLKVTRTIASVNDTAATMNVTYGGDDAEHMTAIKQVNNMGDAIVLTP